jgi:hypothetical protein
MKLPECARKTIYDMVLKPFRSEGGRGMIDIKVARRSEWDGPCHPLRNDYKMYATVEYDLAGPTGRPTSHHRHRSLSDYTTLRALSNVSHNVRDELGSAFWTNADVSFHDDWGHMPIRFLADQPSAAAGIKMVSVIMKWEDRCDLWDDAHYHARNSKYFARNLDLEDVYLDMVTNRTIAQEIVDKGEDMPWVKAFRKMKIGRLHIYLIFPFDEDFYVQFGGEENEETRQEKLKLKIDGRWDLDRKWERQIEGVLRPPIEPTTVVEIYLAKRAKDVATATKKGED